MLCWETIRDLAALKGRPSFWPPQLFKRDRASGLGGFSARVPAGSRSATDPQKCHLRAPVPCPCFTLAGLNQASKGQFYSLIIAG